jgi:hypothetical protein
MKKIFYVVVFILILIGCTESKKENIKNYDKGLVSYFGGDIITMEGKKLETTEAVVTNFDEIVFVGSKKRSRQTISKSKAS